MYLTCNSTSSTWALAPAQARGPKLGSTSALIITSLGASRVVAPKAVDIGTYFFGDVGAAREIAVKVRRMMVKVYPSQSGEGGFLFVRLPFEGTSGECIS